MPELLSLHVSSIRQVTFMENSPCFSAVLYFRFCISSFSKNDRPTIFLWDCCKIIVPRKIVAAEIFAGSSGVADAELFQSPGRGSGAAAIPGSRKFRRLFGNYTCEQTLYTRPGAWSRGNSWLAEISGGFSETTPADKLLSTAKRCLANYKPYLACSETMSCLQISECHVKKWSPAGSTPSQTPFSIKLYIFPSALLYRSRFC